MAGADKPKPVTLAGVLASLDEAAADAIAKIQAAPGYATVIHAAHASLSALETGIADLRTAIRLNA